MYTGLDCFENIRLQGIGQCIAIFKQTVPNITFMIHYLRERTTTERAGSFISSLPPVLLKPLKSNVLWL